MAKDNRDVVQLGELAARNHLSARTGTRRSGATLATVRQGTGSRPITRMSGASVKTG